MLTVNLKLNICITQKATTKLSLMIFCLIQRNMDTGSFLQLDTIKMERQAHTNMQTATTTLLICRIQILITLTSKMQSMAY